MEKLEREIVFLPAWDKRNKDPKKNYGIHGVQMCWYLKGSRGTVQFITHTNWHLPKVQEEMDKRILDQASNGVHRGSYASGIYDHTAPLDQCGLSCLYHPNPADLGFHSKVPMYDGQKEMQHDCDRILGGGPCYYDGSGTQAQDVFALLVEKGSEAVWQHMEERYYDVLCENTKELTQELEVQVKKLIDKAKGK